MTTSVNATRGEALGPEQVAELALSALESALGLLEVYESALGCCYRRALRREWQLYLARQHERVAVLRRLCDELGVHPLTPTAGRQIVRHANQALVLSIETARDSLDRDGAELVAAESVLAAETRDTKYRTLLDEVARHAQGRAPRALDEAREANACDGCAEPERSLGWVRELWIQRLGMPAALPPP